MQANGRGRSNRDAGGAARDRLKRRLFQLCDKDQDNRLNEKEMRGLAGLLGFEGDAKKWQPEFAKLCREHGIKKQQGMPESAVLILLDDQSENGCYCTNEELELLLQTHSSKTSSHPPREDTHAKAQPKVREQEKEKPPIVEDGCGVFFAGANFKTTEATLRELFTGFGSIEELRLFKTDGGKSKGMGLVVLASPALAQKAVSELKGREVDGRKVSVKIWQNHQRGDDDEESSEGDEESSEDDSSAPRGKGKGGKSGKGLKGGKGKGKGGASSDSSSSWSSDDSSDAGGKKGKSKGKGKGAAKAQGKGKGSAKGGESDDERELDPNTVFFAGADFSTDPRDLRRKFEEAGVVTDFTLFRLADGRSRGMGLVVYQGKKPAKRAITALAGCEVDGRELFVKAGFDKRFLGIDGKAVGKGAKGEKAAGKGNPGATKSAGAPKNAQAAGKGGKGKDRGWPGQGWDDGWGAWDDGAWSTSARGRKADVRDGWGGDPAWEDDAYWGPPPESNRVFFAGAPFATENLTLRRAFEDAGPVRSLRLFRTMDGRSRGMGVVVYETTETAGYAMNWLQGMEVEGRPLFLQEDVSQAGHHGSADEKHWASRDQGRGGGAAGSRPQGNNLNASRKMPPPPPGPDGPPCPWSSVFFYNVPCEVTESHLRRICERPGVVKHLSLYSTPAGKSQGMGVVEYWDAATAERAYYDLHEVDVGGRPMLTDEYVPSEHP